MSGEGVMHREGARGRALEQALATLFMNPEDAPCPGDGCCGRKLEVRPELLALLEPLVERLGTRLHLRYLYKCVAFNRQIGGGNDFHALGLAVDVDTARNGIPPVELAQLAWSVGFNAVGVYGTNERPGYKGKQGMVHLGLEVVPRYWGDWTPEAAALPEATVERCP